MPQATPNSDTHCTSCGEPLSIYRHCWQCEYPPMDPKQEAPHPTSLPNYIPCNQCGACYANETCARIQPQAIAANIK